jgi:hypothetical protein
MKNTGINAIPSVRGHVLAISANLALIAAVYLFLGASVSYLLKQLFPPQDEAWNAWPKWAQLLDVAVEMAVIVVSGFWISYVARFIIPIVHVPVSLEHLLETSGGQVSFLYAIFVFLEVLDDKLLRVYKDIFG